MAQSRKIGVFTVVRDEGRLLEKWLRYYGGQFGLENTFILDNDTVDGSTDNLPCAVKRISSKEAYDNLWLCSMVKEYQAKLLRHYDYVVFADCDEFLFSSTGTLRRYVEQLEFPDVKATGYELIHMKDLELPIDYDLPIMAQRRFWFRLPLYDKTLISNHPLDWKKGLHKAGNGSGFQDSELFLLHAHRFDFQETLRRHQYASSLPWTEVELKKGFHHARSVGDEYEEWFYKSRLYKRDWRSVPEELLPPIELIPKSIVDHVREAF